MATDVSKSVQSRSRSSVACRRCDENLMKTGMSVVSLRETLKSALGAILSLPDAAPVPIGDGAFAMDLSAVTGATSANVPSGRAEIPLQGADGEITGVLGNIISIDIPI